MALLVAECASSSSDDAASRAAVDRVGRELGKGNATRIEISAADLRAKANPKGEVV